MKVISVVVAMAFSFLVGCSSDPIAPGPGPDPPDPPGEFSLKTVLPTNGVLSAPVSISLEFSKDVDPASAIDNIRLLAGNDTLSPMINTSGDKVYLNIEILPEGENIRLVVESDLQSLAGDTIDGAYEYNYSTAISDAWGTPSDWRIFTGDAACGGPYYAGGAYRPSGSYEDSAFVARYDNTGSQLWFKKFKINDKISAVNHVGSADGVVYSIVVVDRAYNRTGEIWLQIQDANTGEQINQFRLATGGGAGALIADGSMVYVLYSSHDDDQQHIKLFSANGEIASVVVADAEDLIFINGYLYVSGGINPGGKIFLSKFSADLQNQIWYRERGPDGYQLYFGRYVVYSAGTIQVVGFARNMSPSELVLLLHKYDEDGTPHPEIILPQNIGSMRDLCSDGFNLYSVAGLYRISDNGDVVFLTETPGATKIFSDGNTLFTCDGANYMSRYTTGGGSL